jgi:hypothetical protein
MKLPLAYRGSSGRIVDATGAAVGSLVGTDFTGRATHDHGEKIVAACNAHDAWLEALQRIADGEYWAPQIAQEALDAAKQQA